MTPTAPRTTPDFVVRTDNGSLWLVTPQSDEARQHLEEHTDSEAQWWGESLVVEHRYIGRVVEQLALNEGYRVRVE